MTLQDADLLPVEDLSAEFMHRTAIKNNTSFDDASQVEAAFVKSQKLVARYIKLYRLEPYYFID